MELNTVKNIYSKYQKKWVALSPDRSQVLGVGKTLKEAQKKLKADDKNAIITYVLPFDTGFTPVCHQ